jgi:hypothetical protein
MVEKTQVETVDSTPSDRKTQNTTLLFLGGVALYLLFGPSPWGWPSPWGHQLRLRLPLNRLLVE